MVIRPFLLLLLLLPLCITLPLSTCGLCPPHSTCLLNSKGNSRCLCNPGFTGDHCEIVLCHSSFCIGLFSICENTLQGPKCHCQQGREGSNCQLIKGDTNLWSNCKSAKFCEESFQNGKCEELCNNPECLYDGHDCENQSNTSAEEQDTIQTVLLMVRVDLSPTDFFSQSSEWIIKLSTFLNKTISIARFDGYDRIFVINKDGDQIPITNYESSSFNSSFVEVDLTIDSSECKLDMDDCDRTIEHLYNSIHESIGSKNISSLHISFSAIIQRPTPDSPDSTSLLHVVIIIGGLAILGTVIFIGITQRKAKKRIRESDAPIWYIPTCSEMVTFYQSPGIKRVRPPLTAAPYHCNDLHTSSLSRHPIEITNVTQRMVNSLDSEGRTPLHLLAMADRGAKSSEQIEKDARTLIDNGADVNIKDNDGNTALHLALKHNRFSIVKILLEHPNINVKLVNNIEQTAIHICASLNDIRSLDAILNHPEAIQTLNMTDYYNRTPLVVNILSTSKDTRFARKLLEAGADPNYIGDETYQADSYCERTALHYAAEYGLLNHISLLIEHGANVDAIDVMRRTPLHYAVWNNKIEAIKLLVSLGANQGVHDHYNETPLTLAERVKHKDILVLFHSDAFKKESSKNKRKRKSKDDNEKTKNRRVSTESGYQSASPLAVLEDDVTDQGPSTSTSQPHYFTLNIPSNSAPTRPYPAPIHQLYPPPPAIPIPSIPQPYPTYPYHDMNDNNGYDTPWR